MMFEELDVTEFNPMRDVWFPLDLSNAASFNCIMAHSAAHLAHLYTGSLPRRGMISSDALKYKIEAVKILRIWLADPARALCDDSFAATVRLLTFEVCLPGTSGSRQLADSLAILGHSGRLENPPRWSPADG